MQVTHWQSSGKPQRKSRKTPKVIARKRKQFNQLRQRLKGCAISG